MSDFYKRCIKSKLESDTGSWFVVHHVLLRMGTLKQPFYTWEVVAFNKETTLLAWIETFLRKHCTTLTPAELAKAANGATVAASTTAATPATPKAAAASSRATPAQGWARPFTTGGITTEAQRESLKEDLPKTGDKSANVKAELTTVEATIKAKPKEELIALGLMHAHAVGEQFLPVRHVAVRADGVGLAWYGCVA